MQIEYYLYNELIKSRVGLLYVGFKESLPKMTEQEIYTYHETIFKPIYADMVAILGEKPEQIAFELEATLSHIAVAHAHNEHYDKNIDKAYGHIQRASLDAVKIMWLEYRGRAEKIILDPDLRKFASNLPEGDLLKKYKTAEDKAIEARKSELINTGVDPSKSIELYYEAAHLFREVVAQIDPEKVSDLNKFKSKYAKKEIIISFFVGVASSALVAFLVG